MKETRGENEGGKKGIPVPYTGQSSLNIRGEWVQGNFSADAI